MYEHRLEISDILLDACHQLRDIAANVKPQRKTIENEIGDICSLKLVAKLHKELYFYGWAKTLLFKFEGDFDRDLHGYLLIKISEFYCDAEDFNVENLDLNPALCPDDLPWNLLETSNYAIAKEMTLINANSVPYQDFLEAHQKSLKKVEEAYMSLKNAVNEYIYNQRRGVSNEW